MESASALRYFVRHSITAGEQPTVFSLKSRRSFPALPPVGGEYGAMRRTDSRGFSGSANLTSLPFPKPLPDGRGSVSAGCRVLPIPQCVRQFDGPPPILRALPGLRRARAL